MRDPVTNLRQLLLAGAACAAILPAGAASAQEGVFMKELLGSIGIIDKDREEIIYRERPPLVVPPTAALPPPAAPVEQRTAAWPKDPDVEAKRLAAEEARKPRHGRFRYDSAEGAVLSVDEIRRGRALRPRTEDLDRDMANSNNPVLPPGALRQSKPSEPAIALTYGRAPPRQYLSDPPASLRTPASTAPIPKVIQDGPESQEAYEAGVKEYATGQRR